MMKVIEGLADDVLGIEASGKITKEDYENILIPAAEEKLEAYGKIKMLYQLSGIDGMELGAMWDDTAFGLKHWRDFSHIALVTDVDWIKSMTALFAPLIPAEVRIYGTAQLNEAQDWLINVKHQSEAA